MIGVRLLLMRLGFLESLSEEQMSMVMTRLTRRDLRPGDILFHQDEQCEHLHIVQSGALRLVQEPGNRTVGAAPAGSALGEAGVFLGMPYPCAGEAASDCVVASLHRDDLRRLSDQLPGFAWQVCRLLSRRLMGAQMRVQALSSPQIAVRVAGVLLQLAQEEEEALGRFHRLDGPVTLRVRQAEIGAMAGVSRETVSRLFSEWGRDGLIEVGRGRLHLPDSARLRALLEDREGDEPRV